jgi:hypothetical protein
MNRKQIILWVLCIVIVFLIGSVIFLTTNNEEEFSVDTYLLKFVMKEGESLTHTININSNINGDYRIEIEDIEGLYSLSEDSFYLIEGEEKTINLVFDSTSGEPGVYVGYMTIFSDGEEKIIPIILELQSRDVFFAINLDYGYSSQEVSPGGQISSSVRVYNLRDTSIRDVEMTYNIKDLDSGIVLSESEDVVVGTDTTFSKSFYIPEDLDEGYYVFTASAETYDSFGTASFIFTVDNSFENSFEGSEFFTYVFAISIVIFLFGIILLVFHTLKDRNRLIKELDKFQRHQVHDFIKKFEEKEKKSIARAKTKKNKAKVKDKYEKIKKKEVKKLKVKQKKQHKQLEKMGSKKAMEKKLNKWEKQGFKVPKVKKTKNKESKASKYKKQGYKI